MDFFKILSDIEKVDAEVYERFDTRRAVFKNLSGMGKAVTAATMPAVLGTMFRKAYGQTTTLSADIVNTLNLALSLEYLERYFYQAGIDRNLFTGNDLAAITIIRDDEIGHINALVGVLGSQAIKDPTANAFDYTAGGKLTPFASAALFLGNAQAFVDTGVRAYKGGAVSLMSNKAILTAALNIHSVEARHSSHIRTMRRGGVAAIGADGGGTNDMMPKSWVSLQEGGGPVPAVTAPVYGAGSPATTYPAEDNVTQGGVNVQTNSAAPTGLTLTTAAASEAFDEPLDAATVKTIARNFRSAAGIALGLFN
ncbi:MAG: ferritin-like domain-containing protein [Hymenobacter sp.]|nr:MAG: ferritin-like domain-containing protein [Hymenobacter sp.]